MPIYVSMYIYTYVKEVSFQMLFKLNDGKESKFLKPNRAEFRFKQILTIVLSRKHVQVTAYI
jgi:hypothetical protein